jgi:hypothetical protein
MKRSFHTSFGPTVECRQREAKDVVDNNGSVFTFTEILVLERMVCVEEQPLSGDKVWAVVTTDNPPIHDVDRRASMFCLRSYATSCFCSNDYRDDGG